MNETYYDQIDERVFEAELKNGLKLFIIPKKGFQKTFVTYTTKFGSLDNKFKPHGSDEFVTVPDGVAHFLEHKLFENDDDEEDLFTAFAEDNAQVNAFTSFDRTSYLFSATSNIERNIKRLLTMVETPYFTKETVDKEKGIIAEEIKMYQEQPAYKLMFNTLRAMYDTHPIRVDIAGSVESIYEITKDDLYLCYETFYHPSNMVLFVVGDVDVNHIYKVIEDHENQRDKEAQPQIVRDPLIEQTSVREPNISETMKLQSPRLMLGFKNETLSNEPNEAFVKRDLEMTLFYELIFGEETDFYQSLLNDELIDETFGYQFLLEPTYSFSVITSATQYPDKLKTLLLDEIRNNLGKLDDLEAFSLLKKQFIGEFISGLNSPEYIANQYTKLYFEGVSLFDLLEIVESISLESVNETAQKCLNLTHVVDSRLEMKK
ncbi:EF-P 5-aminopentanol modification-associated protein YfmH [Staphylococcus xylosus]